MGGVNISELRKVFTTFTNFSQNCQVFSVFVRKLVPVRKVNIVLLDVFEFCYGYRGIQILYPPSFDEMFAMCCSSGTSNKFDLK